MKDVIKEYEAKRDRLYMRFVIAGSIAIVAYLLNYVIAVYFPLKGFYDNPLQQAIQFVIGLVYIGAGMTAMSTIFKINEVKRNIRDWKN